MVSAHPDQIHVSGTSGRAIVASFGPREGKVGIVIGGGSGHEPAFACYVGRGGLADASAIGNIFVSPSPAHIVDAALAADGGAGVLFLYGNYEGGIMNFDMASDLLAEEGITARSFLVTDDVASAPVDRIHDRRGIAGDFFVFKVAGAAADQGLSLEGVVAAAKRANENTRTMGVGLSACSLPQTGKANFEIPEGQMELGLGIHGEPGVAQKKIGTADEVTDQLLFPILDELHCTSGDRVAVLVNGLGSTTLLEQYLVHRRVSEMLNHRAIHIHKNWVGEYCTSLEMAGVLVTLMKLDDDLTQWLDRPCDTPALRVGASEKPKGISGRAPRRQAEKENETKAHDNANLATDGDLTPTVFKAVLLKVVDAIRENKTDLCELDGAIGDGDHGVTMEIGWNAIGEELARIDHEAKTISELCIACADVFLNSVGASAGPLYASAFRKGARQSQSRRHDDDRRMVASGRGRRTDGR